MKKSKSFLLILILGFSFLATISSASANFSTDVYINNAFYDDLDTDGYEDDIKVDLSLTLCNSKINTDIDLYVGVTLPSGQEFWFVYYFTMQKSSYCGQVNFKFDLFNTALESGWYWADSVAFAEGERFSYMDSLLFDPPGQTSGGNPSALVYQY